ncbi:MAG: alpha/beta fold hydrolase [Ktedonobacterales bacterium]
MSQSGMAEVNGTRLFYEVAGEGHPLVLSHAGIADSRMWDDQFALFAQRYRVVRYDLRGFGKSEVPPGPFAFRDDLYGLLDFLGIQRAYLIGVSMGGGISVDFTLEHPEMVDALIPVCAGVGGFERTATPTETAYQAEIEAAEKAGDTERVNEMEVHLWVDGLGRAPEQVNPAVRQRVREMNGLGISRWAEQDQAQPQPLDPPAAGRLSAIHVPTLVIVGDQDMSGIQQTAGKLASDIPGADKLVIGDTAHVPNMEKPDEFNRMVLDFLSGL